MFGLICRPDGTILLLHLFAIDISSLKGLIIVCNLFAINISSITVWIYFKYKKVNELSKSSQKITVLKHRIKYVQLLCLLIIIYIIYGREHNHRRSKEKGLVV